MTTRMAILLAGAIGMPGPAAYAQAEGPEFVTAGRSVAIRNCGECHAIDPGLDSPFAPAPPFPQLYKHFPIDRIDEALAKDLLADHPNMKPFELGPDERAEIAAYLHSFRPSAKPKG